MRLHEQVKTQAAVIKEYEEWIARLEAHLRSPKFHEDTTIQVADIFLRINELKREIIHEIDVSGEVTWKGQ